MNAAMSNEIHHIIRDLQYAAAIFADVMEGIKIECCGIESARCIKCLNYLHINYNNALRAIQSLK